MVFLTYIWRFVFNVQCYLATLLGLSTVAGDALVNYSKKHIYRALFDNSTHAIIGGLSWLIVCLNYRDKYAVNTVLEIFSCTAMSSLIDLDHFVMAKSLSIKDATNLKYRPPLHCTTLPIALTAIGLCISLSFNLHSLQRYTLLMFTAFLTHHTRDATRRGYWLYPFGSTQPIPYCSYILITLLIPHIVCGIMRLLKMRRPVVGSLDI